jgi:RHS repeat-associated protein
MECHMSVKHREVLCQYNYDPLNFLSTRTKTTQASAKQFYLKEHLVTEIQGTLQHSVMQYENHLLAHQQRQAGTRHTHLLATDQQRSVLALIDSTRAHLLAYSPYGHRAPENGLLSLLAFNGERPDPVTGCYLLGNGYRAFNPVLMRFNSPDSWSPFGRGGLNAYGYCVGDPINRQDPNGHIPGLVKDFLRWARIMKPSPKTSSNHTSNSTTGRNSTVTPPNSQPYTVTDDKSVFLGYHGTSVENAQSMLATGVHNDTKHLFITNTYEGARAYANFHTRGEVVSVHTTDFKLLHSNAARGTAKAGTMQIDQVKIAKAAHSSLALTITGDAQVSSNFNRFMSEQEHTNHWVMRFRDVREQ